MADRKEAQKARVKAMKGAMQWSPSPAAKAEETKAIKDRQRNPWR